jgi:hypothetical protein
MSTGLPSALFDRETTYVGELLTNPAGITSSAPREAPLARVLSEPCRPMPAKSANFDVVPGTAFIVILGRPTTDDDQAVREVLQHSADPADTSANPHPADRGQLP